MKGKKRKKREGAGEASAPSRSTVSRQTAFQQACRLLAIRGRSQAEVETYLLRKGWSSSTTSRVLQSLVGLGYINDLELARSCADRYLLALGWGPAKVAWELKRRGVAEEAWLQALGEVQSRIPEEELARVALTRKFGGREKPAGRADRCRRFRFLVGRGFDRALAAAVAGVDDLGEEMDEEGY